MAHTLPDSYDDRPLQVDEDYDMDAHGEAERQMQHVENGSDRDSHGGAKSEIGNEEQTTVTHTGSVAEDNAIEDDLLAEQLQLSMEQNRRLIRELAQSKKEVADLKVSLEAERAQHADKVTEKSTLVEQLSSVNAQLRAYGEATKQSDAENKRLREELSQLQRDKAQWHRVNDSLQQQVKASTERAKQHERGLKACSTVVEVMNARVEALLYESDEQEGALRKELESAVEEATKLARELELQKRLKAEDEADLRYRVCEQDQDLLAAQKRIKALQAALTSSMQESLELKEQNGELLRELERMTKAIGSDMNDEHPNQEAQLNDEAEDDAHLQSGNERDQEPTVNDTNEEESVEEAQHEDRADGEEDLQSLEEPPANGLMKTRGLEIELDDEDLSDLEDDVHNEDKNAELSDGELREPSEEGPVEMPTPNDEMEDERKPIITGEQEAEVDDDEHQEGAEFDRMPDEPMDMAADAAAAANVEASAGNVVLSDGELSELSEEEAEVHAEDATGGEVPFQLAKEPLNPLYDGPTNFKPYLGKVAGNRKARKCKIGGCGRVFADRTACHRHIEKEHRGIRWECPVVGCGHLEGYWNNRSRHIQSAHRGKKLKANDFFKVKPN